jgi:hypothetical protein
MTDRIKAYASDTVRTARHGTVQSKQAAAEVACKAGKDGANEMQAARTF